jgi:hypothetical protein
MNPTTKNAPFRERLSGRLTASARGAYAELARTSGTEFSICPTLVQSPFRLTPALSTPVQARGKLASLISCRLRVECPRRRNERAGVKARAGSVQHPGSLTPETGFRGRFAQAFTIQHHRVKAGNN